VDVLDLLRDLVAADRRAAVWCAAQCARTALHLIPAVEDRPRSAVETALAWARGHATREDCRRAEHEAARARDGLSIDDPAKDAAAAASDAVALCDPFAHRYNQPASEQTIYVLVGSTVAAASAIARTIAPLDPQPAADHQLERLRDLVQAERWPLTMPSPEQLRAAPAAVQVAWDAVGDTLGDRAVVELTMLALVEAYARAERLGLDWDDPVQRAVAERTVDEAAVAALLQAGTP